MPCFTGTNQVSIVAAAFSGGQPKDGVEEGAKELIQNDIIGQLQTMGWQVEFDRIREFNSLRPLQDSPIGIVKNPRWVGRVCQEVADQVERIQRDGKMALTIGGDHSLGLGTLTGTSRAMHAQGKDFCCIWVDAHADINTLQTTPSGNLHGMPLAFLLGLCDEELPKLEGFEWLVKSPRRPVLNPLHLVYIGLRDVDAGEKEILKQHGIKAFSMHQVDKWGIGRVVEMALDHANPHRDLPIHLSFDVDALDPSVAPATGTPVRGGLTFREGHYICEALWETGLLCAIDLMEVNPTLGDPQQKLQTVQIGCSLIRCALGEALL